MSPVSQTLGAFDCNAIQKLLSCLHAFAGAEFNV